MHAKIRAAKPTEPRPSRTRRPPELFARHFGVRRVLVVCPTSLKHHWKSEFARSSKREVQVIHGLRAQRQLQYREDSCCKIINYETLAPDADLIEAWAPEMVIADEAQRIKNWNTIAARALKRIASPYAEMLAQLPARVDNCTFVT